jgi:type IV secretory pathway VirB10-like protein
VAEDGYDSQIGKILLIPQGARLVGQYEAQVAFGQSRALLVWNRLIMPNGRSIVLERQPGADPQGYAGLEDEVDNHWGMLFKAAILSTILSVGSETARATMKIRLCRRCAKELPTASAKPAGRSCSGL